MKLITESFTTRINVGWLMSDVKFKETIAGEDWYTATFYELDNGVAKRIGTRSFVLDNDIEFVSVDDPSLIQY